jgi:hypothetical protein
LVAVYHLSLHIMDLNHNAGDERVATPSASSFALDEFTNGEDYTVDPDVSAAPELDIEAADSFMRIHIPELDSQEAAPQVAATEEATVLDVGESSPRHDIETSPREDVVIQPPLSPLPGAPSVIRTAEVVPEGELSAAVPMVSSIVP